NALLPILVNDDGNSTFVNDEHSSKQLFPIDVTPSGIVIVEILVFINAFSSILINDDGNSMLVNDEHHVKHSVPIDVTPSGTIQSHFVLVIDLSASKSLSSSSLYFNI
ncbi:MAG: hypothetical protein MR354_08350, partial [Bacteroides xylanisolvens]|nr:hypothetical protein [Bacteroides xylanisolvens]